MDDRAFDYLETSPLAVQENVVQDFRPRRFGESDYSGAVTSFVKQVRNRIQASGSRSSDSRSSSSAPTNLLNGFRERYPMDDRAWDYLESSSARVQRRVMEDFQPKREGESDYSRLLTSFVKSATGKSQS